MVKETLFMLIRACGKYTTINGHELTFKVFKDGDTIKYLVSWSCFSTFINYSINVEKTEEDSVYYSIKAKAYNGSTLSEKVYTKKKFKHLIENEIALELATFLQEQVVGDKEIPQKPTEFKGITLIELLDNLIPTNIEATRLKVTCTNALKVELNIDTAKTFRNFGVLLVQTEGQYVYTYTPNENIYQNFHKRQKWSKEELLIRLAEKHQIKM